MKGSFKMKPETQDLLIDIVSFSHGHGWELTLSIYRKELEDPDLWSGFDKEMMKNIFAHTKNESHRMRACDFLIKEKLPAEELIDLLCYYSDLVLIEAGKQLIIYLASIIPEIKTESLRTFFELIFSIEDDRFEEISIKIADEVSRRDKPKPLS